VSKGLLRQPEYTTWLFVKLTPNRVVLSFLLYSFLPTLCSEKKREEEGWEEAVQCVKAGILANAYLDADAPLMLMQQLQGT
jgi:hypothetical protein